MTKPPSRTTNRLHFTDLDPIRFEDLCLGLVYPLRPWLEIRHYGRLGSDGGVDILALEPVNDEVARTWLIQCRRYSKASKSTLITAVDDALSRATSPPYTLLTVLACDVTKEAHETYQLYATKKGVVTPILWTASTLEVRLYEDRKDLLFAYFGISFTEELENAGAAQFHAAEYSVLMSRVSKWETLQYATWPILIVVITFLAQMENLPPNYRWWAALISTWIVYVAYQGIMLNMLHSVLVIERDLRPIASQLVKSDNFWIYERTRQKDFPANPAWSPWWPVVISFSSTALIAVGIVYKYDFHLLDGLGVVTALFLAVLAGLLTRSAEQLKKAIIMANRSA